MVNLFEYKIVKDTRDKRRVGMQLHKVERKN